MKKDTTIYRGATLVIIGVMLLGGVMAIVQPEGLRKM